MADMSMQSKLILAFVTLIIGAVLIGVIATNSLAVTDKITTVNEAIDISSARLGLGDINITYPFTIIQAPSGWKVEDCPITNVVFGNATDDWTVTTDYTLTASTGVLVLANSTNVRGIGEPSPSGNDTLIDYTYCADDYMNLGWGRTLINLVSGFFALAILGASLGLFYSVAKDAGII